MLIDARVRLEGRLEIFEAALEALRSAVDAAARGDVQSLQRALAFGDRREIASARRAVEKLAMHELDLQPLLSEWGALRARGQALVSSRLRRLWLPTMPIDQAIDALARDQVLYEATVPEAARVVPWLGGASVGLVVTSSMLVALAMAAFMALMVNVNDAAASAQLAVTRSRLVVNGVILCLCDVVHVELREGGITVLLRSGGVMPFELPEVPLALSSALCTAGVPLVG